MPIKIIFAIVISSLFIAIPAFGEDSWSEIVKTSFIQGCIQGVVDPARSDYFKRAKQLGNSNPKPFPEEELRRSVEPMCYCVTEKLIASDIPLNHATDQSAQTVKIIQDAIASGECRLEGALGETISGQQ